MEFPFLVFKRNVIHIPMRNDAGQNPLVTGNCVAGYFLEAVAKDPEAALPFISKNYADIVDLGAVRDFLEGVPPNRICARVLKAQYASEPRNCITSSVAVFDEKRNVKRLLHMHMVSEPNQYGQWKIYAVEQE